MTFPALCGIVYAMKKRRGLTILESIFLKTDINESGCWNWSGYCDKDGYARYSHRGKTNSVAQFVFEMAYGKARGSLSVCHTCDNPRCIRPSHLFLGTTKDNMLDAKNKGRLVGARGEKQWNHYFTANQVLGIRKGYEGMKGKRGAIAFLAREYETNWGTIAKIVKRQRWNWI